MFSSQLLRSYFFSSEHARHHPYKRIVHIFVGRKKCRASSSASKDFQGLSIVILRHTYKRSHVNVKECNIFGEYTLFRENEHAVQ